MNNEKLNAGERQMKTKEELRIEYVEQRFSHITQDYEKMSSWIWDTLWTFADDMDFERLVEEVKAWNDEEE